MTIEQNAVRPGAISRRRIVQGMAWTTPAVLIATAAPALAASNPTPVGVLAVSTAKAVQRAQQWTGTANVKAASIEFRVQNQGQNVASVASSTVTFKVVGAASPGSPNYGWVYKDEGWVITTSNSGGDLLVVATYSGTLGPWGNAGGGLWVEIKSNTNLVGQTIAITSAGTTVAPATAVPGQTVTATYTAA